MQWSRNREHILCRANYRCRGVYVKNIMLRASCLHIMSSTYDALANRGFTALFCKQVTLVTHRIGMWFTCSTIITVISIPMNRMLMICATSYYFFTCNNKKKGVLSAVGFPHCAWSKEGLFLSPKPYPHKCVEAGARTRDLPVTNGRLYRCTRPALLFTCNNLDA